MSSLTDNHLVSSPAIRSVQISGSADGLPEGEVVHETGRRDGGPDPVTDAQDAGQAVQTLSGIEMDTSLEVGSGADDGSNAPLSQA